MDTERRRLTDWRLKIGMKKTLSYMLGVTLMELMNVVAVIGILTAIT